MYADDTLVFGSDLSHVGQFTAAIATAGKEIGMTLHWKNTKALSVCSSVPLRDPNGECVQDAGCIGYLGGVITADGKVESELSRQNGLAARDFRALQIMWGPSRFSRRR